MYFLFGCIQYIIFNHKIIVNNTKENVKKLRQKKEWCIIMKNKRIGKE